MAAPTQMVEFIGLLAVIFLGNSLGHMVLEAHTPFQGLYMFGHYLGPFPIVGDKNQLFQVIMNLLTNGVQAIDDLPGTREKRLTLSLLPMPDSLVRDRCGLSHEQSYLMLRVADTGKGIAQGHLNRIFGSYFTTKKKDWAPVWAFPSPTASSGTTAERYGWTAPSGKGPGLPLSCRPGMQHFLPRRKMRTRF